jgi:hypothetical protein
LSCERAKTQANAITKNKRMAKCWIMRNVGVRRKKVM